MKKKIILSLALTALLIAIFAISVCAAEPVQTWDISQTSSDNVTAYLYNDGNGSGYYTLTISGTGNMENWASSSAPWYSVNCDDYITSVTIEEGVTSIGDSAFYYFCNLTSIVIPEGVSSIGEHAFSYCDNLTSVVIPKSVTSIGEYAFSYCDSLTSIVIPEGVSSIGNYAFWYCSRLTSIVIPESVTTIGEWAFSDCSNLTSIVIPEGVTSIGNYAFSYCDSLTIYCEAESQPSGWSSSWNSSSRPVVWGHSHSYDSATDLCVCGAKNNYIEKWDISKTSSDNVTAYLYNDENNAGYYTLTISGTGDMENWYDYAHWYSSYGSKITSVTINEGVTSIGDYAFRYCSSLTSIVIPESVTSIGDYTFRGCTSLTSIVIPEGVTFIGYWTFAGCTGLTSIVIPESVTFIGDRAFYYCESLTSIVIPEGVTSIGRSAFYGSYSLTIYCEAESQPSRWDLDWNFNNCPVVWGYAYENVYLEDIFTFKGYSFSANGGFAVGFAIDYDALAKYEAKTGKTLEIGVVFAGYENLGGKQPLDQNGEAIELDLGMVKKAEITSLGYKYYDFMLTGFDGSIMDIKLVIAGYIFDGEAVKYVQANGMSDTVNGITYNEALNG